MDSWYSFSSLLWQHRYSGRFYNWGFEACKKNGIAFLEVASPEDITLKIDEGVRVIAGHREDTAIAGRKHSLRKMQV